MAACHIGASREIAPEPSWFRRRSFSDPMYMSSSEDSFFDSRIAWSDDKDIITASVVRAPNRDSEQRESGYRMDYSIEEGMAAHIAMFIPSDRSESSSDSMPNRFHGRKRRHTADAVLYRTLALSDQAESRPSRTFLTPQGLIMQTSHGLQIRRRAVSLDNIRKPRPLTWPGKPGPAIVPHQPPYPPPHRMPTPPGLPSFDTPEAMYCASQFLHEPRGGRADAQHSGDNVRPGFGFYVNAIRGFFGWSTPVDASATSPPEPYAGIGRAHDGTIVHGRFPYRQSGHNMNMTRNIHDHPFAQNTLPGTENNTATSAGCRGEKVDGPHFQERQPIDPPRVPCQRYGHPLTQSAFASSNPAGLPTRVSPCRTTDNDQTINQGTRAATWSTFTSNYSSAENNMNANRRSGGENLGSMAGTLSSFGLGSCPSCLGRPRSGPRPSFETTALQATHSSESQQTYTTARSHPSNASRQPAGTTTETIVGTGEYGFGVSMAWRAAGSYWNSVSQYVWSRYGY